MKKILLVAATPYELAPLLSGWALPATVGPGQLLRHQMEATQVSVLITGVGLPLAAFALGQTLARETFDVAVQAGVGGAIDRGLALGQVVGVRSESFFDLGVEEADGRFTSVHQLQLIPPDVPPFRQGKLHHPHPTHYGQLPLVEAISVNRVHGFVDSIAQLTQLQPGAQVESMEGAAFFYACLLHGLPFFQIRAISNYVEPRNRANWQLATAIDALHHCLWPWLEDPHHGGMRPWA